MADRLADRVGPDDVVDADDLADDLAFRAAFRESFDAIVIADDAGRYVEVNPAACELFGLDRADLLGRSIDEFAPDDFDFEAAWSAFVREKRERGLFPLVRPDGDRRTVEYSATHGMLPGFHLSILRDVTRRVAREQRLRRQHDELDTLDRINVVVRATIDAVVEARTREDLERTACRTIAGSDLYAFALVGEVDRRGAVAVRSSVGVEAAWLDRLASGGSSALADPAWQPTDLQVLTADDVAALPSEAADFVRGNGARSLLVAPLTFGTVGYGFLAVGATRPAAFHDRAAEGFGALAHALGFAANAIESKQALSAPARTVLGVAVADPHCALADLAAVVDGPVEVESLVPRDAASYLAYVSVPDGSTARATAVLEARETVDHVRVIEVPSDRPRLEVIVRRRTPIHDCHDLGAHLRDVRVDADGVWAFVATLASARDVRDAVDTLADRYPTVTVRSKGTEAATGGTVPSGSPLDRLTARQADVLEAAYRAGYYEWPRRGSSATELAATLDVSRQTVLEHLRKAERVVIGDQFERR